MIKRVQIIVGADTADADRKLDATLLRVDKLARSSPTIRVGADVTGAMAKLGLVSTRLGEIGKQAATIKVFADTKPFLTAIATLKAQLDALNAMVIRPKIIPNVNLTAAAAATGAAAGGGKGGGNNNNLLLFPSGGGRNFGGNLGLLATGQLLTGLALWHVALEGVIEALIAVGTAAAAAAVGIGAMIPTAQDIYTHLKAVQTVSSALDATIKPMTGTFDKLASAMAPQTIEIYGGALNLVNRNTGVLSQTAHQVVTLFDTWIAKIGIWSSGQRGFAKILQTGVGFLQQFGHVFGELGMAFSHLFAADPGIAHVLLDIVGGLASVLNFATKLPTPLLTMALGFHGIYIWSKILIDPLLRMGASLGILNERTIGVIKNALSLKSAWFWVGAAAIGLGILAYKATQADAATKAFISNMDARLSNDTASQAIMQISNNIGSLDMRIKATTIPSILDHWGLSFTHVTAQVEAVGGAWGHVFNTPFMRPSFFDAIGNALKDTFVFGAAKSAAAANQMRADIAAMTAEVNKQLGAQKNLFAETGNLVKQGYSVAQAFALMNLAGVKWNDSVKVMAAKIQNLITGYQNLVGKGATLNNALNAVTFQALLQQSKVAQLNQGWDTFFKTITDGEDTFVSFAQATQTLDAANKKSGASMNGLSGSALTLRSDFLAAAKAAGQQIDALTTMQTAAGMGQKGVRLLDTAVMDYVKSLLPAAKNSSAMTTILYALAQRGGYTGADSFKALSKWVTNTHDPMQSLDKITTTFSKHAGNLTTDVKNLSTALGTTLTNAMATAVLAASGGLKPMENLYKAIHTTGVYSDTTKKAAQNLAQQFDTMTQGNLPRAKQEFEAFAVGGLHLTKSEADKLWNSVKNNLAPSLAPGHGSTAETAQEARTKIFDLNKEFGRVPKNVHTNVSASASGSGNITFKQQAAGQHANGYLEFHAAGGRVGGHGGPTADDQLIAASTGEYVINARSASRLGMPFLNRINRYAGGGPIEDPRDPGRFLNSHLASFEHSEEQSFMRAAIKAMKQATMNFGAGFGKGGLGRQSLRQIEDWWMAAGGPGGIVAHIAAAITGAESGFSPGAVQQGQPYATTGWGLWQITPGNSEPQFGINGALLNPMNNARAAVAKFRQAGGSFSPWTTFMDGAYRAFMDFGGWLPPGKTLVTNNTGRPERVLPPGSSDMGNTYNITVNVGPTAHPKEVGRQIVHAIREYEKGSGTGWRTRNGSPS